MTNLVLPNGVPVDEYKKAIENDGKAHITGLTPWRNNLNINGRGVNGASTKKGKWSDYYGMYKRHSIVRAAVDKIAKTATNVGYEFVPRDSRTKPRKGEVTQLQDFFSKQHDFISELRRIYKDLLIYGDAYLYIVPDRRRRPLKLKRLHPKTIYIKADINGTIQGYYQKDPDDLMADPVFFAPEEILHFRIDDPDNDLYGLSPLESLKDAVASDIYAQIYNGAFFKNSAVTGTIIAVRNANPDEVQRNRKWLEDHYTGPDAAHKPLVIEGESVDVKKSVASHNEMGFLELRKFVIMEILAVLDVPPAKVGMMESANRSNSKEQDNTFRTESVTPIQYLVESVLNDGFIRSILGIENTIFKHSEADTRDQLEAMDYYTKGEAWGIFTPNEIRSKLGMAPVDGGDTPFIMSPTGAVPIDRLDLYFKIPKPNTDTVPALPRSPAEGEPQQGPVGPQAGGGDTQVSDTQTQTDSNPTPVKSLPTSLSLQGMVLKLTDALDNDNSLRQAYAYAVDAADDVDDYRINNIVNSLSKACRSQDDVLKRGYIERAHEAALQMFKPIELVDLSRRNEGEDSDYD